MHQRPALPAWEHRRIEFLLQRRVGLGQDQATAWPTQGLVGGGGHHIGVRQRIGVQARRYQARDVGHVDEQVSADLVGDLAETGEVEGFRVGGEAGHDHFRLMLDGQALDFVVVDQAVGIDAVLHGVVQLAGGADLGAVGQVPAVGQAHAQQGIAGLQQRQVDRRVGLRARVRLDVGVTGAEQCLGPVDGQLLDHIDMLATAVVALARVALGILVGQHAALGQHHLRAGVVLRGNELDVVFLTKRFAADGGGQRRVEIGQGEAFMEHGRFLVVRVTGQDRSGPGR
ncbi:hypothetical protein D3C81_242030 [compost metagenome]